MNTFEIIIQRGSGEGFPIVAELSRSGEFLPVRKEGQLQLDEQALLEEPSALAYGTLLGRAVFRDEIRDAFLQAVSSSQDPLHVLLSVEAKQIRTLRWERLCAPFDGAWDFLAQQQQTPFSLYLPSIIDRLFPAIGRRDFRALVAVACPQGMDRYGLTDFDVESSAAGVRQALGPIPNDLLVPATLDALCDQLTAGRYTLLHIVCHGKFDKKQSDTSLFLADADNKVDRVTGTQLLDRLRRLPSAQEKGLPHFTFLASCESALPEAEAGLGGLAQRLVRDLGMPAVLAMTDKISTATTQALTERFYRHLRTHGEVDRALAEAMAGLAARHDVTVPVICSRLGGRPLFSDMPDRPLTASEIRYGLAQLEAELPKRAPVLFQHFLEQKEHIERYLDIQDSALSSPIRDAVANARLEVSQISKEVLADIPFEALALGAVLPPYDDRCPFPGLAAFRAEDGALFSERKTLVETLAAKLAEHHFLAILGPSGSGKSSLVLAGLAPAMQKAEPGLQVAVMRPGNDPVAQLDRALANLANSAGPRPLLIVDQFEEIFILCADDNQRGAFISRLLSLCSLPANLPGKADARVVLTLRDDFWRDCAQFSDLSRMIQANHELVAPLNTDELRKAMEHQAHIVNLRFEADLITIILEDVQDEPGAMPLLQHALAELWKRRHGGWLLLKEYNAIGGVRGAIAHTANGIYEQLASEQQKAQLRQIFTRLTHLVDETIPDGEHRDTRQRVDFDDLVPTESSPTDACACGKPGRHATGRNQQQPRYAQRRSRGRPRGADPLLAKAACLDWRGSRQLSAAAASKPGRPPLAGQWPRQGLPGTPWPPPAGGRRACASGRFHQCARTRLCQSLCGTAGSRAAPYTQDRSSYHGRRTTGPAGFDSVNGHDLGWTPGREHR